MQGPSHLLVSWYFAEAAALRSPRERRIVAWAGFAPDIDVLAYVGALAYYRLDKDLAFENVWQVVHHRYTHNLSFVLLTGIVAYWLARGRRASVAFLAMLAWSASWSWTIGSPLECFGDRADAWLVRTVRGDGATSGRLRWLIWAAILLAVIAVLAPLGFELS